MPSTHPAAARLRPAPFVSGLWLRGGKLYVVIETIDFNLVAQKLVPDETGVIRIHPDRWVAALSLANGSWQLLMHGSEILDDEEDGYPRLRAIMAEHRRQPRLTDIFPAWSKAPPSDEIEVWNRLLAEQANEPGPADYPDEWPETPPGVRRVEFRPRY